jgi:hypothetical protein
LRLQEAEIVLISALLAQQGKSDPDLMPVFISVGALIVVVVVLGIVLVAMRKRMFESSDADMMAGSIFEDLRRLKASGEVSELEYDYLRKCIAARAADREPPPRPPGLAGSDGELRARPGFDLTGAPIPPEVLDAERRRKEKGG